MAVFNMMQLDGDWVHYRIETAGEDVHFVVYFIAADNPEHAEAVFSRFLETVHTFWPRVAVTRDDAFWHAANPPEAPTPVEPPLLAVTDEAENGEDTLPIKPVGLDAALANAAKDTANG